MRKLIAALLMVALGIAVFGSANAQTRWVTERLNIRTNAAANPAPGFVDSSSASLGAAATIDTTVAFRWPVVPALGVADSNQFVIVGLGFASTLASGESLYVGIEGSADNGATWRTINGAAIGFQGIKSGASCTNVANAAILFNAAAVGTTNVTGASTVAASIYGNFFGWPQLRLKVRSDVSGVITQSNSYSVYATYLTRQ